MSLPVEFYSFITVNIFRLEFSQANYHYRHDIPPSIATYAHCQIESDLFTIVYESISSHVKKDVRNDTALATLCSSGTVCA